MYIGMYAHYVPHTYSTLTPKQTNSPEPRKIPGDFHVRPTGFDTRDLQSRSMLL